MGVAAAPSAGSGFIPEVLFALFQCFFCVATVQVMIGGSFERGRLAPSLLFGFIWATVVYCPVACWTWNGSGWLYNLPSLDYAGGKPQSQSQILLRPQFFARFSGSPASR